MGRLDDVTILELPEDDPLCEYALKVLPHDMVLKWSGSERDEFGYYLNATAIVSIESSICRQGREHRG